MKKMILLACTGLMFVFAACTQSGETAATAPMSAEAATTVSAAKTTEAETTVAETKAVPERHKVQGTLVSLGMSRMVMETTEGEELDFYIVGADKTFVMEPQPGVEIEVLYLGDEIKDGDTSNVKVVAIDEIWDTK